MADDQTQQTNSALAMDRAVPLGNSRKPGGGRNRLHVKIDNDGTEPIPIVVIPTMPGVPFFKPFNGMTSPGAGPVTLWTIVVPGGLVSRNLILLRVSCIMSGRYAITQNGNVVGAGRTGPGALNDKFEWTNNDEDEGYPTVPSDVLELTFEAVSGNPSVKLDAFLSAVDVT